MVGACEFGVDMSTWCTTSANRDGDQRQRSGAPETGVLEIRP